MVININEDLCEERGISVEDMLLILLARISKDIPVDVEILMRKGRHPNSRKCCYRN